MAAVLFCRARVGEYVRSRSHTRPYSLWSYAFLDRRETEKRDARYILYMYISYAHTYMLAYALYNIRMYKAVPCPSPAHKAGGSGIVLNPLPTAPRRKPENH